jgi:hypothetical protein
VKEQVRPNIGEIKCVNRAVEAKARALAGQKATSPTCRLVPDGTRIPADSLTNAYRPAMPALSRAWVNASEVYCPASEWCPRPSAVKAVLS